MKKIIKLGTRDSPLAMWQARHVQDLLREKGVETEIIAVKSDGDLNLVTPLYAMGVQGVFTKTLDAHLISGHIDIAVHSMKDVPVQMAQGIDCAAVLERASAHDVIVWKSEPLSHENLMNSAHTIGTGSVRRQSQWLHRYPSHHAENLRGNLQTRFKKLENSSWVGAIFASAGLDRINFQNSACEKLDWMIPAPAQGAIMVACRTDDAETFNAVHVLNHELTELCVVAERQYLNELHGGCSAPVGAHMYRENNTWHFEGCVSSLDGKELISIHEKHFIPSQETGIEMAKLMYNQGAQSIIEEIRSNKK